MPLRESFKPTMLKVCDDKIAKKGENVGLSFYAFFSNKNTDPALLIEVAHWWIVEHRLDHFEKAIKVKQRINQLTT